jgi:hypothetical protein
MGQIYEMNGPLAVVRTSSLRMLDLVFNLTIEDPLNSGIEWHRALFSINIFKEERLERQNSMNSPSKFKTHSNNTDPPESLPFRAEHSNVHVHMPTN